MSTVDSDFADAVHDAVNGKPELLVAILRSDVPLGASERDRLAKLAERCAELARGEIGGTVGRPDLAAGSPKVVPVVDDFQRRIGAGMQRSKAKSEVAEAHGIGVRTVEKYLRLDRERRDEIDKARNQIIKNDAS